MGCLRRAWMFCCCTFLDFYLLRLISLLLYVVISLGLSVILPFSLTCNIRFLFGHDIVYAVLFLTSRTKCFYWKTQRERLSPFTGDHKLKVVDSFQYYLFWLLAHLFHLSDFFLLRVTLQFKLCLFWFPSLSIWIFLFQD